MSNPNQPPLAPTPMPVYPTMESLQAVVGSADSKLPISTKNELFSLLMTYHNTLLKVIHVR